MNRYSREVDTAKRLAREAGVAAMAYRGDDLKVALKPGDEPVTAADHRASEIIIHGLSAAFPDDIVISEESADDLRRLSAKRVWYIDPIDGTKDFIRGLEGFSVMVGLTVAHRPAIGVVYQPVGDRMFWSDGETARFTIGDGEPTPMTVSEVAEPSGIRLVASNSHRSKKLDKVKSALGIANEFNIGSVGLKLCLIALAERDLYVNSSSHCKAWDTCAPEAILAAAGGSMTDVHGDALRYDQEDTHRRTGLVASNGRVHAAVIDKLASLFPRQRPPDEM